MSICPAGHESAADDYCDVCGLPISAPSEEPVATDASASALEESHEFSVPDSSCPNCGVDSPPNALFCENCGYDFTTGATPRPLESMLDLDAPEPTAEAPSSSSSGTARGTSEGRIETPADTEWVAEVWVDPDWYSAQQSDDPLPSAGMPTVVPLRKKSSLVGRTSRSRGIDPDIDLGDDHGISRRHCQLTTDGSRWWVEDLDSSNGTFIGRSVGVVPRTPLRRGEKRELAADEQIYLGAWTRIVLRKATPGEI